MGEGLPWVVQVKEMPMTRKLFPELFAFVVEASLDVTNINAKLGTCTYKLEAEMRRI